MEIPSFGSPLELDTIADTSQEESLTFIENWSVRNQINLSCKSMFSSPGCWEVSKYTIEKLGSAFKFGQHTTEGPDTLSFHVRLPHTNQPMPHFWKVLTQPGLEPRTFHFRGRCSDHWATGLGWLINVKSEMAWWLLPLWLTTASQSLLTGNTQLHQNVHGKRGWIN